MSDLLPDYPRLHALLGDAVRDLPNALAEKMEDALSDAAESAPPSAFFTFLQGHSKGHRADGTPWAEIRLTPGRALDLALATRSASGITALTAMLHAAHVAGKTTIRAAIHRRRWSTVCSTPAKHCRCK